MEHVIIDDLEVAFETVGTGPPLVLLHGILQDSRVWQWQLHGLREAFTVVAWDAPGCGRSADPPESWRFSDYADCLHGLISALRLVDPFVVGLSWGGTLAIEYQRSHAGVAAGLVLAGAYAGWAGSLTPESCRQRLASCLAQAEMRPEEFIPTWLPGLLSAGAPPELVVEVASIMAGFHAAGFRTMAQAVAEADLRPYLPAIDIPVLLLYGESDQRAPVQSVGEGLRRSIPSARLVPVPAAGHLCNVEQPDFFNDAVRAFTQ